MSTQRPMTIHFKFDELIAQTIRDVLSGAFPAEGIPDSVEYDIDLEPMLDAEVYHVYVVQDGFDLEFEVFQGGWLLPGGGEPEPVVRDVRLCMELDDGRVRVWDLKSRTWVEATAKDPSANIVVMNVRDYENMMENLYVQSNSELRDKLDRSMEQFERGGFQVHDLIEPEDD